MKYLSLFSGIEAATVAWHPLGWECVGVSEIEPFPCAVLAHHYPTVPNLGDVTQITEQDIAALGTIDLVVFGSPCQDLSVAGHRKGLINADGTVTRSGLFFTAVNIFTWARKHCGARFALWENVPGAFSSNKGRDFGAVVEFLAGLDDVPVPDKGWGTEGVALGSTGLLEWATLDAQWFGVAQRRRRVFALLDTGDWACRPPILLEPEGLRGDSAPSRGAGEAVANSLTDRPDRGGTNSEGQRLIAHAEPVSRCDTSGEGKHQDWETCTMVATQCVTGAVTHSLRARFAAGEDGTGRGQPIVPAAFSCKDYGAEVGVLSPTLRSMGYSDSHANGGGQVAVAFNWNARAAQLPSAGGRGTGVNDGLTCSQGAAVAYCIKGAAIGRKPEAGPQYGETLKEGTYTLNCVDIHGVMTPTMQVRRLTPAECEKLQGFPTGYTNIPWRKQPTSPDGPRYKALGNSMAVPVMRWIGGRIQWATDIERLL